MTARIEVRVLYGLVGFLFGSFFGLLLALMVAALAFMIIYMRGLSERFVMPAGILVLAALVVPALLTSWVFVRMAGEWETEPAQWARARRWGLLALVVAILPWGGIGAYWIQVTRSNRESAIQHEALQKARERFVAERYVIQSAEVRERPGMSGWDVDVVLAGWHRGPYRVGVALSYGEEVFYKRSLRVAAGTPQVLVRFPLDRDSLALAFADTRNEPTLVGSVLGKIKVDVRPAGALADTFPWVVHEGTVSTPIEIHCLVRDGRSHPLPEEWKKGPPYRLPPEWQGL